MRLVIKVGSSTLVHSSGKPNIRGNEKLCKVISDIKNAGHEIVLVSSGAIAMGMGKLGVSERPEDMPGKQAMAAVGQCELMYAYDKMFSEYSHVVSQILITGDDIREDCRREHFKNTVFRLLKLNVLPIINENDTVSTAEISVGDNDTLAAIVAKNINAQLLVLLTDTDGLYSADPKIDKSAKLLHIVNNLNDDILAYAGGSGSLLGTGGMETKLHAAQICMECGIETVIANGSDANILYDIVEGKEVGTRFKVKL